MPYILGRRYLVFPRTVHEGEESLCGFTGRLVEESAAEVALVRDYYASRNRYRLRGRVAASSHESYVELSLLMGESRPPKGVRVVATQGESSYTALVDDRGEYEIKVPSAGDYRISVSSPAYLPLEPFSVAVPAAGCAIRDIALSTGNTIEGQLRDPDGKLLSVGTVTLRDADPAPPGRRPFELRAYASKSEGSRSRTSLLENTP
ncbi:MAG: carboxypeptidase-like regulatory domain-containing protein [Bryobacteraceae bacterium]|nr:carboxypeptidase-like regulatory domain-containing protein [Bryobacteraceae bacterium]